MTRRWPEYLAYGLPALPVAALYLPAYLLVPNHYATEFGLSLASLGVCLILIRCVDAISDPLIGALSDRTPRRWGRRRVWIMASVPVCVLGAMMLFAPGGAPGLVWYTLAFFVVTLGWSMAATPYYAWGAEMSGNYAERSSVALWRESLGLVGTVVTLALYGAGGTQGMERIAWMIAIVMPVAVGVMLWRLPEPVDHSRTSPRLGDILGVLREEALFRRLVIAQFLNGFANGLAATLFVLFVLWRLEAPGFEGLLLLAYFFAAVAAAPFWGWASGRVVKPKLWCLAMIYAGVIFAFTGTLGPGDWPWFLAICILSGAALGADLAIPASIQADLVDLATARTKSQQTGAFFALWSLINKMAVALSSGMAFILLDWAGFEAGGQSTALGDVTLTLLYAGGPIAFKGAAIFLMWGFKAGEADQAHWRASIEQDV